MSLATARWSQIVERSHRSPLTLREFARREGVNPRTLAWWRWKLKQSPEGPSGFVEVQLMDPAPEPDERPVHEGGLVVEVGGAQIAVDSSSDLRLLRAVVEALA